MSWRNLRYTHVKYLNYLIHMYLVRKVQRPSLFTVYLMLYKLYYSKMMYDNLLRILHFMIVFTVKRAQHLIHWYIWWWKTHLWYLFKLGRGTTGPQFQLICMFFIGHSKKNKLTSVHRLWARRLRNEKWWWWCMCNFFILQYDFEASNIRL